MSAAMAMPDAVRLWHFQAEIDKLVASGFAEVDDRNTERYARSHPDEVPLTFYIWTPLGQCACFRFRYSTPMSWAEEMQAGTVRHCVACGRDTYRHRVYEKVLRDNRTICMQCGREGKRLPRTAEEEVVLDREPGKEPPTPAEPVMGYRNVTPTEEGHYWYAQRGLEPEVVRVHRSMLGVLSAAGAGSMRLLRVADMPGLWYGPLAAPTPPAGYGAE